jgi:predicted transcriptional regulator
VKEMEQTFGLREAAGGSSQLWTRELARKVRGRLERDLEHSAPGDAVVIDAKGVEVFDYSFANELFGKILIGLPNDYPGRFVIVTNLTTYTRENLAKALEGLGLAMIERKGRSLALLGKLHSADEQTFAAIAKAKTPLTAAMLAEQLNVNLTAMNERLTKLSRLALVRRVKTISAAGREHYNGETRRIEVNAHQAVKALLEHAIKEFNVTNQPHLLSLFREDGTRVEENQSIEEAGITPMTTLQLRPDAVKGGSRC